MDAVKGYEEVDRLIEDILKLREKGGDFENALIEDFADYLLGHLRQINQYIVTNGDRLDMIDGEEKTKKVKKK